MSAGSLQLPSRRRRRTLSWKTVIMFGVFAGLVWCQQHGWLAPAGALAAADEMQAPETDIVGRPEAASEDAAASEETPADAPEETKEPADTHATDHGGGGHAAPEAPVLLAIFVILLCAKVAGDLFERVGMPAVLGELSVGILLGNWALFTGQSTFDFLRPDLHSPDALAGNTIDILARIGVVLLLFEVGLESRVKDMFSVGVSSLLVALLGVVVPIVLGLGVGFLVLQKPFAEWQVPAFLGATLCATSVGITARVLKDLGRSQDRESKIILGAAVIDDVLGLIVLAVVTGVIREGENFEVSGLVSIVVYSFAFLAAALGLGALQLPRFMFKAANVLRGQGLLVATALVICFGFSYGANLVGLAPIIGAFAAGLILENAHYQEVGEKWKHHELEEALAPLTALLVPIFFVSMGISVDLNAFADSSVWFLAIGLTIAAIIGKLACMAGVREKGLNTVAVGLGMIPRGEVGLIFANEGKSLKTATGDDVISGSTFSAIVVMVMVTTMVTPPLLKWSMSKRDGDPPSTE